MIISEKQTCQLIQIANIYLDVMKSIENIDKAWITECGSNNKKNVALLLQEIYDQQSDKLIEIK